MQKLNHKSLFFFRFSDKFPHNAELIWTAKMGHQDLQLRGDQPAFCGSIVVFLEKSLCFKRVLSNMTWRNNNGSWKLSLFCGSLYMTRAFYATNAGGVCTLCASKQSAKVSPAQTATTTCLRKSCQFWRETFLAGNVSSSPGHEGRNIMACWNGEWVCAKGGIQISFQFSTHTHTHTHTHNTRTHQFCIQPGNPCYAQKHIKLEIFLKEIIFCDIQHVSLYFGRGIKKYVKVK